MSQELLITIIVILGVIALYLIGLLFNLGMVVWFRKALKTHRAGMAIAAYTKYDNLSKLIKILQKHKVDIDESVLVAMNSLDNNSFSHPENPDGKEAIYKLTYVRESIMAVTRRNEALNKHSEFKSARENVLEMDVVYRNAVSLYNADILGYNYWVRFLPYRYMFILFKIKTKELI